MAERDGAVGVFQRVVVWQPEVPRWTKGIIARFLAERQLKRLMKEDGVDVLKTVFHVFGFGAYAEAMIRLSRQISVPWICTVKGAELYGNRNVKREREIVESASAVYCVGESATNFLRAKHKDLSDKIACRELGSSRSRYAQKVEKGGKKLTFFSCGLSSSSLKGQRLLLTARLMTALAKGRTSTKVKWIHKEQREKEVEAIKNGVSKLILPENLEFEFIESIKAVDEPLDWYMFMDATADSLPETVGLALSAGLPVIACEIAANAAGLDDDCALILSQNPTDEEFVRGILPYLDSNVRYEAMKVGAKKHWAEKCDALKLRREFYEREGVFEGE